MYILVAVVYWWWDSVLNKDEDRVVDDLQERYYQRVMLSKRFFCCGIIWFWRFHRGEFRHACLGGTQMFIWSRFFYLNWRVLWLLEVTKFRSIAHSLVVSLGISKNESNEIVVRIKISFRTTMVKHSLLIARNQQHVLCCRLANILP